MNDDLGKPGTVPDQPASAEPAAEPARRGRARRLIITAVPVVLVLVAVAGAAVYTKATVDSADRTVTTALWQKPAHGPGKDPAGDFARGRTSSELSRHLLPVPSGFQLGPDSGEYGNDAEISGRAATAEMKDAGHGLAGRQRREFDKSIDKLRVQGLAVRTYASDASDMIIETQLVRMKDKKAVRDLYAFQKRLYSSAGVFRDGPKVDGHEKNAKCLLPAKGEKREIEGMSCIAYEGEFMITVRAFGTLPFERQTVAELVKDQLNHITSPGEYV